MGKAVLTSFILTEAADNNLPESSLLDLRLELLATTNHFVHFSFQVSAPGVLQSSSFPVLGFRVKVCLFVPKVGL